MIFRIFKIIAFALFFGTVFLWRCANPAQPEGGPRDSLPPRIVSMVPANNTVHFSAQKIYILFDEYIQLKEVQKNIFISPELERRPVYTIKGRGIQIELKGDLDSATTYKIDFGDAIADNNEGNVLRGFSYVFSTGGHIDSLVMTGQIIDAFTGDSLLNATALLYDAAADSLADDSLLYNARPLAIARTDSTGVFLASNLRDMYYRVYALKDDNGNRRYERGSDMVGFTDSSYNPTKMPPFKAWYNPRRRVLEFSPQEKFYVFQERPLRRQVLSETKRLTRNNLHFVFADRRPRVETITLDSVDMAGVLRQDSRYGDTIALWLPGADEVLPDTLKGRIDYYVKDSIGNDSLASKKFSLFMRRVEQKKKKDDEKLPNPFRVTVEGSNSLTPYSQLDFVFTNPIAPPDMHAVELFYTPPSGDEGRAPRAGEQKPAEPEKVRAAFTFQRDSIDLRRWHFNSEWVPAAKYDLMIPAGTFQDIAGYSNDTLSSSFTVMNPARNGKLILNVTGADPGKSYIVWVVRGKEDVVQNGRKDVRDGSLVIDYVRPQKGYKIKVVEDADGNGRWDVGDPVKRIPAERIAVLRDAEGNSRFEVKENWEIELDIPLDKLFKKE